MSVLKEKKKDVRNPSGWIRSPLVDTLFISWGWLIGLAAFALVGFEAVDEKVVILGVLAINFLHRHITFPVVYGDPEILSTRRRTFVWLPFFFLGLTLVAAFYVVPPELSFDAPLERTTLHLDARNPSGRFRCNLVVDVSGVGGLEKPTTSLTAQPNASRECVGRVGVEFDGRVFLFSLVESDLKSWIRLRNPSLESSSASLKNSKKSARSSRPLLFLMAALSVLWTIWHALMQKMGLLRAYAAIGKTGSPHLDRTFVFSGFAAVFFSLLAREDIRDVAAKRSSFARAIEPTLAHFSALWWTLSVLTFLFALVVVIRFVKDLKAAESPPVARASFALSLLALYVVLSWDLVIGYALLGLSHSLEYLCFVWEWSRKKYASKQRPAPPSAMARWAKRPLRSFLVFAASLLLAFAFVRFYDDRLLHTYIIGSSFLHFLFDGWIWKMKKPSVSEPLSREK